jgi:hypothetical protein
MGRTDRDDSDTVAAIAGGLSAYWGQSAIPLTWVRKVDGWPGLRGRHLVRLAALTSASGSIDPKDGQPPQNVEYGGPTRAAVRHPLDDGVFLGTEHTSDHDATAIVSLFRRGTADVPFGDVEPENHLEVRLLDSDDPADNPNLAFTLADSAAVIAEMRGQGHRVLLHCVRAEQRTPSVAVEYAVRLGATADAARAMIADVLPHSRQRGRLWDSTNG